MKALNNHVHAAGLLAASEALLTAEGMGLDLYVLNASSGRNLATEAKLRQFILSGGFGLRLAAKDLATAHSLQALAEVDARQLALCDGIWKEAVEALPAGADNTTLFQYLQRRGGRPAGS